MKKFSLLYYRFIGTIDGMRMAFDMKKFYIATMIGSGFAFLAAVLSLVNDLGYTLVENSLIYLAVAAVIVVAVAVFKGFYDYVSTARTYVLKKDNRYKKEVLERLTLSNHMVEDGYRISTFFNGCFSEYYVMSDKCNHYLYTNSNIIKLVKHRNKFQIVKEIRNYVPFAVSALLKNNYVTFNGSTIRQMDELFLDMKAMHVQPSKYFDGQCTNELVYAKMRNTSAINEVVYGENLLIDENNSLYELDDSPCSNYIGVSTLAITEDNCLVIMKQGAASNANAQRYAPSGSGSSHGKDLKKAQTLGEFLINGMERELCEECNINRKDTILTTRVIGYARLLERGAKPDFFGITMISSESRNIAKGLRTSEFGLMSDDGVMIIELKEKVEFTDEGIRNINAVSEALEWLFLNNSFSGAPRISIQLHIFNEIIKSFPQLP